MKEPSILQVRVSYGDLDRWLDMRIDASKEDYNWEYYRTRFMDWMDRAVSEVGASPPEDRG